MLVLLGVPWMFSAFAVINAEGSKKLETLQGIFNVGELYTLRYNSEGSKVASSGKVLVLEPILITQCQYFSTTVPGQLNLQCQLWLE